MLTTARHSMAHSPQPPVSQPSSVQALARGARLGGVTGQYALRMSGYDAFILSPSVIAALNTHRVLDGAATSKSAQRKVQDAFNAWHAESGERHAVISQTLAFSVPD